MSRPDEAPDPSILVRAAVDVLVFAPLGFGAMLVEDAPAAVGRARRELSNARFLGRITLGQGLAQVRSRLEPVPQRDAEVATGDTGATADPAEITEESDVEADHELFASDLALPDYDTLPAIDIVAKLQNLSPTERDAIERYEAAHRKRRTVLGKLAQLAGAVIDPDVRPVDPDDGDDVAQIATLEREARAALVGERGGDRWLVEHPEVGSGWEALCREEAVDVIVAHLGAVVVGYLVGILGQDRVIRVDQVWVTPMARENGWGDALLEAVIDRAKAAGAVAVQGESLPGDRHTKNLYERAGIVARLITTYRDF